MGRKTCQASPRQTEHSVGCQAHLSDKQGGGPTTLSTPLRARVSDPLHSALVPRSERGPHLRVLGKLEARSESVIPGVRSRWLPGLWLTDCVLGPPEEASRGHCARAEEVGVPL